MDNQQLILTWEARDYAEQIDFAYAQARANAELNDSSLVELSREELNAAYALFAKEFPTLNQLADEAMEQIDTEHSKRVSSVGRAAAYSVAMLLGGVLTLNPVVMTTGAVTLAISFCSKE
jgi:hypothetical protein